MPVRKLKWFFLVLVLTLAGCAAKPQPNHRMHVVTSVDFYAEVAKAVVGTHGTVTSVINDPAVDPHDFDPTVTTGKMVAKADLVLANGAGYDAWMNKLTAAEPSVSTLSAAKIVGVKNGQNEHIWYTPTAMPKIARALATKLGRLDPKHKADYQQNAKTYIKKLQPLMTLIDQLKQNAGDKQVAVSEPVFNNALAYMDYRVANTHFAQAVEEGSDPSPQDVRQLNRQMATGKIAFFVVNTQVSSKIVDNAITMAKKYHIPILHVTETLPKGLSYTSWMTKQYRELQTIQN
ncbi:metal ABC transporter solute-binding protein, Zn/Mn family [Lacticaseibacillus manihotivorans]|uniref:Metal ABC transporter substrate-binding protein n=1 Tax=Lacticaseibacillus manihotivorans TaxID=88233 RepID=A0A5P8JNP2_9LACO|nr:zinc ABC transporter substrate-binding protein [Lacticaseibacillus manihotivorans]QFQ90847.1 metal ABC transporter substrate-binding protein [Lacticaseibacillus manihotivorans]